MTQASPARGLFLAALLAAAPLAAHAQVYKCIQANGTTGFQSTPCASGDKPATRPSVSQLNAQRASAPKDAKPYDDPYAGDAGSRAHAQAPGTRAPSRDDFAPPPTSSTSRMIADVQARNRREAEQQAYQDAHKNDKHVDLGACNTARFNLGVLNEQRPVYYTDSKGNRVYVEDKDRAAKIAQTQQVITDKCP